MCGSVGWVCRMYVAGMSVGGLSAVHATGAGGALASAAGIGSLALLQNAVLWLIGLSSGGIIAAGVFAFLAIIGVFPRIIGKTCTNKHILLYETVIVLGGVGGNVADLYNCAIPLGEIFNVVFGLSSGIFVGCLVMSLAETLKTLPVISRRIGLSVGLQYLIVAVAFGKLTGSLIYFFRGMSGS